MVVRCLWGRSMGHKCYAVDSARKVCNPGIRRVIRCSTHHAAIGFVFWHASSKIGVLGLLICCPFVIILLHRCLCYFDGNAIKILEDLLSNGTSFQAITERWMEISPNPFDSTGEWVTAPWDYGLIFWNFYIFLWNAAPPQNISIHSNVLLCPLPAVCIVLKFLVVELLLMRFVPGSEFNGGRTATGHIPK